MGCAAGLALATLRGLGRGNVSLRDEGERGPRGTILALGLPLLAAGVWLRVARLGEFEGGILTSDERWASVIYVSDFVHRLEPHRSLGASLGTLALLVDVWNRIFGFEPVATRRLTVVAGLLATGLYYVAVRRLAGPSPSLVASGLLCVSPFAVFVSRLALEPIYPVFFFIALLLSFSLWRKRPGPARALSVGLLAGFGCFVYAGFPLALVALAAGWGAAFPSCNGQLCAPAPRSADRAQCAFRRAAPLPRGRSAMTSTCQAAR